MEVVSFGETFFLIEFYLEQDNELTDAEVEEIHRTMVMDDLDFK